MTESTALAPAYAGTLPAQYQAMVELHKVQNAVVAELAKSTWGQRVDRTTLRAIAEWGRRHEIDPITEIDILGGNPYVNSRYYIRQLAKLIQRGEVEYVLADHIANDDRLAELMASDDSETVTLAKEEHRRRIFERINQGVPEAATGACVFRVKLRKLTHEVTGTNWCGGGTGAHKAGGKGDPVGDMEPVKTAESRAARRCVRKLVDHYPTLVAQVEQMEREAEALGVQIQAGFAKLDAEDATNPFGGPKERVAIAPGVSTVVGGENNPVARGKQPMDAYLNASVDRLRETGRQASVDVDDDLALDRELAAEEDTT